MSVIHPSEERLTVGHKSLTRPMAAYMQTSARSVDCPCGQGGTVHTQTRVEVLRTERVRYGVTWITYGLKHAYVLSGICECFGTKPVRHTESSTETALLGSSDMDGILSEQLQHKLRRCARHLLARASGTARRPQPTGFCAVIDDHDEELDQHLGDVDHPAHASDPRPNRKVRSGAKPEPRHFRNLRGRVDDIRLYGRVRRHVDRRRITPATIDG